MYDKLNMKALVTNLLYFTQKTVYVLDNFSCKIRVNLSLIQQFSVFKLSRVIRNPAFCICENKGADQLRGNRAADQRFCFR